MRSLLLIGLSFCAAGELFAATFVVTNSNDSGPGSLRQAILDTNADPVTADEIHFRIPGDGVKTIALASPLPRLTQVTIDGYSQPGARPNSLSLGTDAVLLIELNGSALPGAVAFSIGSQALVRGLVVNGSVTIGDSSSRISGCYIGTNATGSALAGTGGSIRVGADSRIGGTNPADRNVIATMVEIRGPDGFGRSLSGNRIEGNYIGVGADGRSFLGGGGVQISVGHNNVIGGATAAARNVIAGSVTLNNANGNLVGNNWIGVDATGMTAKPNGGGLSFFHGTNTASGTAGSTTNNTILQNLIVRSSTVAAIVYLAGGRTTDNSFKGNLIGLASDGKTPLGNHLQGFAFHYFCDTCSVFGRPSRNSIGGLNPGDGNVIAFNPANGAGTDQHPAAGIADIGPPPKNFIHGNSISGQGGLAIDLGVKGVTPNDAGDTDGIQNYPVLTTAVAGRGTGRVTGSLHSVSTTAFRIEFFGNDSADPSGYRQAQHYLGFVNVTTDANGNAFFDTTLAVPESVSEITSTATGPTGTSELSATPLPRLLNISTRASVRTGEQIAIGGFILTGTETKRVLLRGIGPSLQAGGVSGGGHLVDPVIDLWSGDTLLAENNDWKDWQRGEVEATGLAPTHDRESALVMNLAPGAYTLELRGRNQASGIGLVEIYDLTRLGPQLANISTRGFVGLNDNVLIGGFILGGNSMTNGVVVRGLGPSVSSAIRDALGDPTIDLRDSNGARVAFNDDWNSDAASAAELSRRQIAPSDARESAIFASLPAGLYTVILAGKANSTGVALVEVYHLQ